MNRISWILFLLYLHCTLSAQIHPEESRLPRKRFNKCSITILVETNQPYASKPMPSGTTVHNCIINYVYLISHYISYDERFLEKDERIQNYNIVRSNYEDYGYLPFILSILHTSTYTMIIKDEYFVDFYPDESWMSQAIMELRKRQSKDIATCYIEELDHFGTRIQVPKGCMFFKSLSLRSILTKTEFRRTTEDPFFFFSQALKCKFQARIVMVPSAYYIEPRDMLPWYKRFTDSSKLLRGHYSYEDLTSNCESVFQIEDVECQSNRKMDHSIGIVLSQYKRDYIYEQIDAIQHSSMSISEMVVYQNGNNRNYRDVFKQYPFIHHIWSTNWNSPFFLRHLIPMLFQTSYHIVFDDDIIPGVDTIKELISTVHDYNAPSGVGGRIIEKSDYRDGTYRMICVDCFVQNETVAVDFVIQVYARTSLQSKVYWRYRPYTHRNGDDMHGSLSWFMECGRRAQRPVFAHSSRYKNYGTDNVASYFTATHNIVRPQTYRSWILGGYHGVLDTVVRSRYPHTLQYWEYKHADSVMRFF